MKQISVQNLSLVNKREALNEAIIQHKLNNEYIVKYYDSFLEGNFLNIIMEYCDGGDLENYIKH